ncbi:MAG: helix-turn-helix transcriptional regulator [Clostridia bacterium]|nr:helix-turn-helix transcriptional regulator [Clostridia bacterium]
MNISKAVAMRIAELLKAQGLTQYRLEQKACLSHDTIKSIMKGKAKGVNLKTVIAIADGFGMSVSKFLDCELFAYDALNMD